WCAVFAPLAILMTGLSAAWLSWRARHRGGEVPVAGVGLPSQGREVPVVGVGLPSEGGEVPLADPTEPWGGETPMSAPGSLRRRYPAPAPLHPVAAPPSLAARRSSDAPSADTGVSPPQGS